MKTNKKITLEEAVKLVDSVKDWEVGHLTSLSIEYHGRVPGNKGIKVILGQSFFSYFLGAHLSIEYAEAFLTTAIPFYKGTLFGFPRIILKKFYEVSKQIHDEIRYAEEEDMNSAIRSCRNEIKK